MTIARISPLLAFLANGLACSAGASSLTTLHQFAGGSDGGYPVSALLLQSGLLYSTTTYDKKGVGSMYSIDPKTGAEKQLYAFPGAKESPVNFLAYIKPDLYSVTQTQIVKVNRVSGVEHKVVKLHASGGLVAGNGLLYGTTSYGGPDGAGSIYSLDPVTKAVTVLYGFLGRPNGDGAYPEGGMTLYDGVLYGATPQGGADNGGIIFSFNLQTQQETVLYSFTGGADGSYPLAPPILVNGLLYGTTTGVVGYSTAELYSLNPTTGALNVLHTFAKPTDADTPFGELCYKNGHFYGTSQYGGANDYGAIYDVDAATGKEKVLYSFQKLDGNGQQPLAGLTYVDGAFYGTTSMGDSKHYFGTVFRFTP